MANKFVGFLEAVGKDFAKGLGIAVTEAPVLTPLVTALWPGFSSTAPLLNSTLTLLSNTALSVEQKFAAAGQQSSTGAQKSAEVLSIAGPAAVTLLSQAGVKEADTSYVSKLIDLVVAVLNVKSAVTTATA